MMMIKPKHKPHHDDDRDMREREHLEQALDAALENTFPASDPVSIEQPTPANGRGNEKRKGVTGARGMVERRRADAAHIRAI